MIDSNRCISLCIAIEEFNNIIIKNYGINSVTAKNYLRIADKLMSKARASNLSSLEILKEFYTETVGQPAFEPPSQKNRELPARAVFMVLDLLNGNNPKRRYSHRQITCPSGFREIYERYKAVMVMDQKSEGTVRTRAGRVRVFFTYLDESGCRALESLTRENLLGFITSLAGRYSSQGRASILYTVRNFFSFDEFSEKVSFDPIPFLVRLHSKKHERLNSFYTASEVCHLLEVIDRSTPWGKSVYLMLLLAGIYGLRSSDIKTIRLNDIDWKRRTLSFTQYKTKRQVVLPITDEVLFAFLDYLKNARPESSFNNVFIRFRRPYIPYSTDDHLWSKIQPYFKKAGINTEGKHHGLHSLRHSLATSLLGDGVPINEIATILGHTSATSTKAYVWSDIEHLRIAAMEVPNYAYR